MSLAAQIKTYISNHYSIRECLRLGLINYSALARKACEELGIRYSDAATMAVSRIATRYRRQPSTESELREIIKKSKLIVRSKMLVAATKRQDDYEKLLVLQNKIKEQGDDLTVIEGLNVLTIITSSDHSRLIKTIYRNNLILTIENLAQVILLLPRKVMYTPGFARFVLSLIAERGINVIEEVTCSGEHLLLVEDRDLTSVLQALKFENI